MRWAKKAELRLGFLAPFQRSKSVAFLVLLMVNLLGALSQLPVIVSAASALPRITSSDARAQEGGLVTFTLTLSNSQSPVNGGYSTTDGSATAPDDYIALPFTSFIIEPGKPIQVTVQTKTDTVVDPNESFLFKVMQPNEDVLTYNGFIIDVPPICPAGQTGTPPNCVTPPPTPPLPTTPTPTPTPDPTPEPTSEPEPTITDDPEVLNTMANNETPSTATPIMPQAPERAAFVRAVPTPQDLKPTVARVIRSLLIAGLLVLLIMFPADLFNSTLQSNYDEIIGWFKMDKVGKLHRKLQLHRVPIAIVLSIFAALVTLLNTQLSPDFGFNRASAALLLGMFIALTTAAAVYDLSRAWYLKRRFGINGKLRAHALGLGVGALFVTISRLAHFVPGYLYGLFTGLIFKKSSPTDEQDGEGLALASVIVLTLAVAGWFALIPVRSAATQSGASFIALALEAALATLWVSALGMIVFSLAPIRFMYGEQVKKWNKHAWAALYGGGMLLFVYTLLDPNQSLYGKSSATSWAAVLSLFFGFAVFSFAFWGYFRYRPVRSS